VDILDCSVSHIHISVIGIRNVLVLSVAIGAWRNERSDRKPVVSTVPVCRAGVFGAVSRVRSADCRRQRVLPGWHGGIGRWNSEEI
jgi:hypothetical protein